MDDNNIQVDSSEDDAVRAARRSLLKAVWEASGFSDTIATKFSSKPLDMDGYFTGSTARGSFSMPDSTNNADSNVTYRQSIFSASYLTTDEKMFLEELLQSEDHESIQYASKRLADKQLFPPIEDEVHELLGEDQSKLSSEIDDSNFRNSCSNSNKKDLPSTERDGVDSGMQTKTNSVNCLTNSDRNFTSDFKAWIEEAFPEKKGSLSIPTPASDPFMVLSIASDSPLVYPRVLSPPLMESLLAFVPESLQSSCNFWLKYSIIRDGASLLTMLRRCRASVNTILAIETEEGFVFGSFTPQLWQLSHHGFFGSDDSFVWRMRHSRRDDTGSAEELISRENKIDVYPCTSKNDKIQFCSKNFLALGEGELENMNVDGKTHFGNAIRLHNSMMRGSTSTSNTFDNPSLIHTDKRGEEFTVKNIEVWALTTHSSSSTAIRAEMRNLFLEEGKKTKTLNLLEILVS